MMNYYRAIVRRSEKSLRSRIQCPTKILFGTDDPNEEPGLPLASLECCDQGEIIWFEGSRHWPHREEPERVSEVLLAFLSSFDTTSAATGQ